LPFVRAMTRKKREKGMAMEVRRGRNLVGAALAEAAPTSRCRSRASPCPAKEEEEWAAGREMRRRRPPRPP
jgi:hypothetical protein